MKPIPAHVHWVAQMIWVTWIRAWLKVTDIEVGERVIDKAMHSSVGAVHVLVDESWDEVGGKSDDKRLRDKAGLVGHCIREMLCLGQCCLNGTARPKCVLFI